MTPLGGLGSVDEWRAAGPDDMVRFLNLVKARDRPRPHRWENDGQLSPLELYCYLKARFGAPNGMQMAFRTASTDNVVHWDYLLVAGDSFVGICSTVRQTEIAVHGGTEVDPPDWTTLVEGLKAGFAVHRPEIKHVRRGLEKWTLFVNPYRRLDLIVRQLCKALRRIDLTFPAMPHGECVDENAIPGYFQRRQDYIQRMIEAKSYSLSLRMIAPVLAESFVNLVFFTLAKPELKNDSRLLENALRAPMDIRIKSLSLNCDGFRRRVDPGAEPFKQILRLFDARNELLHGNVNPKKLAVGDVYFDYSTIPLFKDEASLFDRTVKGSLKYIEPSAAVGDLVIVRRLVRYVLRLLDPNVRRYVRALMRNQFPGYRKDTKRMGILFSDIVLDVLVPYTCPSEGPSAG